MPTATEEISNTNTNKVHKVDDKYFNYEITSSGRIGNAKIRLTANKEKSPCVASVVDAGGLWLWHDGKKNYTVAFEYVPPKEWLKKTTEAVLEQFKNTGDKRILNDWKNCVLKGLSQLPKVVLATEEEAGISSRRKKRFVFANCDWDDIRSKEMIMGLGFRWNTQKRMFEFYGTPKECNMMLKVLGARNNAKVPMNVNEENMFNYFPTLKKAQQESIRFIFKQWREGWHGALVADDMGIGKTLTSLVAGKLAIDSNLASKIVVFANAANIENWLREWGKLSATKTGLTFALTRTTLDKAKYNDKDVLRNELDSAELVVVNYEYAARNEEVMQMLLDLCEGGLTVFDEVTKCSNPDTENFKAAFKASMISNFAIGLTGTPISKEIYEGWSIFRLLDPAIFPKKEFITAHRVEVPKWIWNPKQRKAQQIITYEYRCPDKFKQRIAPHFIRHEKSDELIFATKTETCYFIESGDKRNMLPEIKIANDIQFVTSRQMNSDIDWSVVGEEEVQLPRWQVSVLGYIQSALDDPYIIYDSDLFNRINEVGVTEDFSEEQKIVYEIMQKMDREELKNYVPAKLKYVESQLKDEWADKHTILFYTSSRACERASARIAEDFPELPVYTIVGSVSSKKREEYISAFSSVPAGVLCCTDALAFGCNFQFADILVHMNLPWSTAVLKQRSDRIFRTGSVGQKEIYYLMLEHPLERRKINVLNRNLETIRKSTNIELTPLPPEEHLNIETLESFRTLSLSRSTPARGELRQKRSL